MDKAQLMGGALTGDWSEKSQEDRSCWIHRHFSAFTLRVGKQSMSFEQEDGII